MTKEEYLKSLKERLLDYPSDIQRDIIDSFIEHFRKGNQEGQSDEEIIQKLGSIDVVVDGIEELLAEGKTFGNHSKKASTQGNKSLEENLEELGTAVFGVIKDVAKLTKKTFKQINLSRNDEMNVMEGSYPNIENCNSLEILASSIGAEISIINGEELIWRFQSKQLPITSGKALFKSEMNGDTVRILIGSQNGNIFVSGKLELIVPPSIKNLHISNNSGDISITALDLEDLSIQSVNGDVDLRMLVAKKGRVQLTNGDIQVNGLFGDFLMENRNGDMDIKNHHDGILQCNLTNGDAKVETNAVTPRIIVNNVNGDIHCYSEVDNYSAEIKTSSGDFEPKVNKTIYKVERGRWITGEGDGVIQLVTVSGDIYLG